MSGYLMVKRDLSFQTRRSQNSHYNYDCQNPHQWLSQANLINLMHTLISNLAILNSISTLQIDYFLSARLTP